MKKLIFIALLFLLTLSAKAQDEQRIPIDDHKRNYEMIQQRFLMTRNAAGMGLFQPSAGSFTTIGVYAEGGDWHRVQEGSSDKGLALQTERYDTFSEKLFMRGSFTYHYNQENDRIWSDVICPYFSSPFLFGSRVARRYETQNCGLTFDLYTAPLNNLISLGIKTNYEVSDIAGNRDPRPRTQYLNCSFIPSILLSLGSGHHIGIDAGYRFSKEKLLGLSTVQPYPNLSYYTMAGLEHVEGSIGGYSGFKRQFVSDFLIADIQYGYENNNIKFLFSSGVCKQWQQTLGDKRQSPGSYNSYDYTFSTSLLIINDKGFHNLKLEGNSLCGNADEYLQELQTTIDEKTGATTEKWVTLYSYENRYMLDLNRLTLSWKYFALNKGRDYYRWSLGTQMDYDKFENRYYLPYSVFGASALSLSIDASYLIVDKNGHTLDLLLQVGGGKSLTTELSLSEETIYSNEVLAKDLLWYKKDRITASGELRYTFPLLVGNKSRMRGFASVKGGNVFASDNVGWYSAVVTIGLFTF